MVDREEINNVKQVLIKYILSGERPSPDEMLMMSESYKQVWDDNDGEFPDWASALD